MYPPHIQPGKLDVSPCYTAKSSAEHSVAKSLSKNSETEMESPIMTTGLCTGTTGTVSGVFPVCRPLAAAAYFTVPARIMDLGALEAFRSVPVGATGLFRPNPAHRPSPAPCGMSFSIRSILGHQFDHGGGNVKSPASGTEHGHAMERQAAAILDRLSADPDTTPPPALSSPRPYSFLQTAATLDCTDKAKSLGYKTKGCSMARDPPGDKEGKARKGKRVRTIFTPEQLERLEREFTRQQYMVGSERYHLAASLNLTEAQVKVWFQNRRIKWRRQNYEQQQARLAQLSSGHTSSESESGPESPAPSAPALPTGTLR